ncbi:MULTISPECIES: hypothetical protein [unclassified Tenacibaculum]|uniref:hypothetical protein n=1 Tax=unclassified Tenacibaculum TaxID=2635139 RepID=UPI001F39FDEB|nr:MULTISPECIES: hypothetical protein [unclassified Tenacibaculum]MCF2874855.1 hypothetical protein [Tenacibaculum sp. Cn5-1]MCF2934079.1 hypothetical protein [Tenacibaculum sp. Cn5-34]MCG7510289.1 hypothetical protein [Tenacibaculum sp. Cn5-46]
MKKIIVLALMIVVSSCQENEDIIIDSENLLLGVWTNSVFNSDTETTTFERVHKLPNEKYGISFQKNGTFVERTSGWCGTPPVTFFNTEGEFLLENKIIKVTSQEFPIDFLWEIVSLDEKKLVVRRTLTDQEKDYQKLMILFSEIETLARSVSCTDSNDWSFIGYGAKACGGFQGYIAYSNKIDVSTFLEKVAAYTKKEDEYNKKWNIVSNCSIPSKPSEVNCVNGFPVFKY